MEVAVIDWKDSKFVNDDTFENINAPQWVDLSTPEIGPVDDEAWFCRPDCDHPKTIDDFLKVTPTSKLQRSASVSEILSSDQSQRDEPLLKKRALTQPSGSSNKESKCDLFVEDGENQNPNLSTPLNHKAKLMDEAIRSSTENKKQVDSFLKKEESLKLKSTLSAWNLFAAGDILNQITEFCTELKQMALRAKERERVEKENAKKSPLAAEEQEVKECPDNNLSVLDERKKPLLEVSKEKYEAMEKSNVKQKLRRRRNDEAENTPICLDLNIIKRKDENSSQIRFYPPSPQCFSAKRGAKKTTTPKAFRSRPQERGILQELEQSSIDVRKEESGNRAAHGKNVHIAAEGEARTLDVFWFLKPCTLSS